MIGAGLLTMDDQNEKIIGREASVKLFFSSTGQKQRSRCTLISQTKRIFRDISKKSFLDLSVKTKRSVMKTL